MNLPFHSTLILILCMIPLKIYSYPMPYAPYYSQSGQDKFLIEKIFKEKKNGIFFDIGAHDGISYSNTYYFEKELDWTGVCVEPQDENFQVLKNNRNCHCIQGCIFNSTGIKDFLKVNGPSEMLSGLLESYDPRHLERAQLEVKLYGGSLEIIPVQTYSVCDICEKFDIQTIDFLSIDTEGSEEMIITSIDFNKIEVKVIAVENNYRENNIKNYLEQFNYELIATIGGDDIYVKKGPQ